MSDDDDATIIDGDTVSDDKTVVSSRVRTDNAATVISSHTGTDDSTVVSARRSSDTDDRTRKVDRAARVVTLDSSAQTAVRLAGGRVASVPGEKTERYAVREVAPETATATRTPMTAPVVGSRVERDATLIEAKATQARRRRGTGLFVAVVVVTLVAVAVVVAAVVALSSIG